MAAERRTARIACVVAIALLLMGAARADTTAKDATSAPGLQQAYPWYDGDQVRTVWLDPHLVADFNRRSPHEGMLKRVYPNAQEVPRGHAGMRLWRADPRIGALPTLRRLKELAPGARYSPVLRDGPTEDAPLRALPGNVIVYFDPGWDEAVVNAWVQARGLEVEARLEIGRNAYVLATGPGLEALETANALYASGEVVAAFPDWWRELVPR